MVSVKMSHNDVSTAQAAKAVRPEVLAGISGFLSGPSYREVIESSSSYNNGIVGERKTRLPYLDSQTGVAQSDCYLWMNKTDRMPGQNHGQLYSYPAKRWKKKRRQYLINESYLQRARLLQREAAMNENTSMPLGEGGQHPSNTGNGVLENPLGLPTSSTPGAGGPSSNHPRSSTPNDQIGGPVKDGDQSNDKFSYSQDNSRDTWYDYDDGSDLPDAGELDDPESDYDDYEYGSSKKKKAKKDTPKRKRVEYSDAEKPFACELCGARYKTRPGLSYHYAHSHQKEGVGFDEEGASGYTPPHRNAGGSHGPSPIPSPSVGPPFPPGSSAGNSRGSPAGPNPPLNQMTGTTNGSSSTATGNGPNNTSADFSGNRPPGKPAAEPNDYCDFCLGGSGENKTTKVAEGLVSCSDCGRSAHPSCLQFTPNMIESVKKYRWQCIECKSCGLCGTSDNDDQLLFCDDCDRGYHMYCLKPPLSEPPEGSWSCHLCIVEYHQDK